MLGVADKVLIAGPSNGAYNAATQFGYRIEDVGNSQIVTPGKLQRPDHDHGSAQRHRDDRAELVHDAALVVRRPKLNVTCVNAAAGIGDDLVQREDPAQHRVRVGLTYSTSNYSGAVIATVPFTCDPASATIPINVQ